MIKSPCPLSGVRALGRVKDGGKRHGRGCHVPIITYGLGWDRYLGGGVWLQVGFGCFSRVISLGEYRRG